MRRFVPTTLALLCATAATISAQTASAQTVSLEPIADGTLFQQDDGLLANGAGIYLFAGQTVQGDESLRLRRALLRFDIAGAVPAGSTVTGAELTLRMNRTISGGSIQTLHRVTSDWAEGADDAPGQEGGGTLATAGAATWIHTSFDTAFWTNPGGDFVAAPSATEVVSGFGTYQWDGPGMVADVQAWADGGDNFGWILIGDEDDAPTAKRFDSRESTNVSFRPALVITFDPPANECPADITTEGTSNGIPDGALTLSDFSFYLSLWANNNPDADVTTTGVCNFGMGGDGVDLSDFSCYLAEWSMGCP